MISVNKVGDMGPGQLSVGSCSERLEALEEQSEAEAGAAPRGLDLKRKPVSGMVNPRRRVPSQPTAHLHLPADPRTSNA